MSDEAYTGGLTPTGLPHAMGPGYVDFGRIPKPADDIIDTCSPEPDYDDSADGRFIGDYNRDNGVLTIHFDRSGERAGEWPDNPSLTPEVCDDYGIDDYGSNAVQLVEREHVIDAVAKLLRQLGGTATDQPTDEALRELARSAMAQHLFG